MIPGNWTTLEFTEAFRDGTIRGHKIEQSEFKPSGKFPIVDQGQSFIAGYANDDSMVWKDKLPVVLFGDHTRVIKYVDFPFVLGADGIKVLIPREDIFPKFAYYALIHTNVPSAGYSRHFKFLKESNFSFPPIEEQRRIAAILDRADRLRRTRRYAAQLSDTFLQAVFVRMFGDPVRNPMWWDEVDLDELVAFISGKSFKFSEYVPQGVRLFQIANVSFQETDWDTIAYLPASYLEEYPQLVLSPGDLLMALNRPILGEKVKFAVLSEKDCPAILYQRVGKIIIKSEKIIQAFLFGLMHTRYFYHELKKRLAGSDQPYINPTELVEMRAYTPPFTLQQKFARIVQQYERLRAQQREAERQAEHLFQTLLRRAFEDK